MSLNFQTLGKKYYSIGKANIWFKPETEERYYLLGDSDSVDLSIEVEETDRFSNECGLRKKVQTIVTEINATITMTLVQLTDVNRALSLLGEANQYTQPGAVGVNEVFVGGGEAGAIVNLSGSFVDTGGTLTVTDGTGLVSYTLGTDFLLDDLSGAIQVINKPVGADGDLDVTYDTLAITAAEEKVRIGLASKSDNTGSLIIRQCQDFGPNVRLFLPIVQLRPAGDRSYVSETDFDTIELEGSILEDSTQEAGFTLGEELLLTTPTV
jgi:hypothetical protein